MKKRSKKSLILLVSVLVLAFVSVSGVLAYLSAQTGSVVNTFTPSSVTVKVTEDPFTPGESTTKTKVAVKNTGDTEAYIRAAVVVTWQDAEGNIYGKAPVAGTDYAITFDLSTGWVKSSDGFYYWNMPVAPGASTGVLISECTVLAAAPADGYTLHVEILGSGIQSKPASVVTTEWASGVQSVSENDGALSIKQ